MKKAGLFAVIGALVLSAPAGCGGNVIVEGSGGNGGGGSGGTGATTSTSSSTTLPPATLCADVCNTANQTGCLMGSSVSECVNGCLNLFEEYPGCEEEIGALYACAVESLDSTCNATDPCVEEANAFSDCLNGGDDTCGTGACSIGDDESCSCQGQCAGMDLAVDCQPDQNGILCSCQIDFQEVGACYDSSLTCDVINGCCSLYFFDP